MKLFLIGNGFDLAHGCHTSYECFQEYLETHRYEICNFDLSDYFTGLDTKQWKDFENELESINFERQMEDYVADIKVNASDRDFDFNVNLNSSLQDSFEEAMYTFYPTLCEAISNFVIEATSGSIARKTYFSDIMRPEDVFITFNYTKLLEKLYMIKEKQIKHIHGIAYPRQNYRYDDSYSYGDPTIIFGQGNLRQTTRIPRKYEYNPNNPQKCLFALNQELKKNYKINELTDFVYKFQDQIDTVEIIGHSLGNVDIPYFIKLNEIIAKSTKIKYWLFDENEENEKKSFLHSYFYNHPIQIKKYPKEQ